jgi:hypothetical protein
MSGGISIINLLSTGWQYHPLTGTNARRIEPTTATLTLARLKN